MVRTHESIGHPIRVVVQRTGLSAATLRAWERRYRVVVPTRSEGGHRLYSDADIRLLRSLVRAVDGGRSIGQIAGLGEVELEALIQADRVAVGPVVDGPPDHNPLQQALQYIQELKPDALERLLMRAAVSQRPAELVSGLLVPLLNNIGIAWREGRLGVSAEHIASVTLRRYLEWLTQTAQVEQGGPLVITGTPSGQRHEFGALLAGVIAAGEGWRVRFLGPELPASEIVLAANALEASMVALSAVHPRLPPELVEELVEIPSSLPAWVDVVIGGQAAAPYAAALGRAGMRFHGDLESYRLSLGAMGRTRLRPDVVEPDEHFVG